MRSLRWMLGLGLVLAACRSESLTPVVETDVGTEDSGTPTDVVVVAMDSSTRLDACVPSGAENTATACGDNIDNDCNGFTDCRDFSCSRNNPAVTFCPDAGTTVRDGSTTRDIGPCTMMGMENTAAACTDGLDNDCDGFLECNDNNCSCIGACPPGRNAPVGCMCHGTEDNTAACGDGVDNDCNGFRDCADFGCSRSTTVTVCRDAAATDTGAAPTDVPHD